MFIYFVCNLFYCDSHEFSRGDLGSQKLTFDLMNGLTLINFISLHYLYFCEVSGSQERKFHAFLLRIQVNENTQSIMIQSVVYHINRRNSSSSYQHDVSSRADSQWVQVQVIFVTAEIYVNYVSLKK